MAAAEESASRRTSRDARARGGREALALGYITDVATPFHVGQTQRRKGPEMAATERWKTAVEAVSAHATHAVRTAVHSVSPASRVTLNASFVLVLRLTGWGHAS